MIGVEELVDKNFEGSWILKLYQAYIGSSKSISLLVEEILARKIGIRESFTLRMKKVAMKCKLNPGLSFSLQIG